MTSSNAYHEGKFSYRKNHGKLINPYKIGTNEHNFFERGYIQALKRSPNEYPSNLPYETNTIEPEYSNSAKPKLSAEQEAVKKAYADLK